MQSRPRSAGAVRKRTVVLWVGRQLEVCIESGSSANLTLRLLQGFLLLSKCEPLTTQAHPFGTNGGITPPSLTQRSFLTQDNSQFDEYRLVSWHIAGDECQTRKEQRSTQQQHRIRCARACHGGEQSGKHAHCGPGGA
jgi:hypothetical protein